MSDALSAEYIANAVAYRLNHYQATSWHAIRTEHTTPTGVVVTVTHEDGTVQRFRIVVSEED